MWKTKVSAKKFFFPISNVRLDKNVFTIDYVVLCQELVKLHWSRRHVMHLKVDMYQFRDFTHKSADRDQVVLDSML